MNKETVDDRTIEESFPDIGCDVEPLGSRIVVQLRKAKMKSKGGIILPSETKATEKYNEVIARVVKLGPTAYKNVTDLSPWPEGPWCKEGDLVRVIKWGGDRWSVPVGEGEDKDWISFIIISDNEVICKLASYEAAKRMQPFVD